MKKKPKTEIVKLSKQGTRVHSSQAAKYYLVICTCLLCTEVQLRSVQGDVRILGDKLCLEIQHSLTARHESPSISGRTSNTWAPHTT